MSETKPTIAIIGAGPAGLIAAQTLAQALPQADIAIYDQMPSLARKFLLAGRGGLNLTHSCAMPEFLRAYGPAAAHLAPALTEFSPQHLQDWAKGLGEPCFTGSSGRVFPKSFKASPLLRAFARRLESLGVRFFPRHRWQGWKDGALVFETPEGERHITANATLLALGGASWPRMGSDARWTSLLPGVDIAPLRPSNCGFEVRWSPDFAARFAGTPLKSLQFSHLGQSLRGEAVIAAYGLEGSAVYALSAALRDDIAAHGSAVLHIDLRPDTDKARLAAKLGPLKGQSMNNILRKAGLSPVHIGLLREIFGKTLPQGADNLAAAIKHLPLKLERTRPIERAISTAGGVMWHELDAHLMLRKRPGVFLAGEMLDFEAPTGGYLLQGAFSTGVLAARGMAEWVHRHDSERAQPVKPV